MLPTPSFSPRRVRLPRREGVEYVRHILGRPPAFPSWFFRRLRPLWLGRRLLFHASWFWRRGLWPIRSVRHAPPLRVLAHKLDLDEQQTVALARILGELKTERAQVEVDARRTMSDYADSLSGESFDSAKATTAADRRTASVVRMQAAIANALKEIHALLDPEQRGALAHLIRAGVLTL